eukprot:6997079-Prymnesium_polylepis.4
MIRPRPVWHLQCAILDPGAQFRQTHRVGSAQWLKLRLTRLWPNPTRLEHSAVSGISLSVPLQDRVELFAAQGSHQCGSAYGAMLARSARDHALSVRVVASCATAKACARAVDPRPAVELGAWTARGSQSHSSSGHRPLLRAQDQRRSSVFTRLL